MEWTIITIYTLSLLFIFLFSLGQLHLTWIYFRRKPKSSAIEERNFLPLVTVQLPVYNEKYVVERLLDAVSKLDYPVHLLEIQVLDDSTDETTEIILKKLAGLRPLGLDIKLIHRENRKGFKAGALANGFNLTTGECIAIFDADFIPNHDFLKKTVGYFENPEIGAVQTRWAHINMEYSILTRLQAFGLDAHFSVEQVARNAAGSFINFNGTCGVWRKSAIADAGGWSADTITEDLDLSYRAQLKGWKFKYLEEVSTPGELPVMMPAIKTQQYRWNKGAAENARKNFFKVLGSSHPWKTKIHAFFHLFNSTIFVCILVAGLLSGPILFIKWDHPEMAWMFNLGVIFLSGFLGVALFYWMAARQFHPDDYKKRFMRLFPGFLIVSMGLSFHNGIAAIEGWFGRKTPFVRTPKFNITHRDDWSKKNSYFQSKLGWSILFEGLLCLYFIAALIAGIWMKDFTLVFFHLMLALGFGSVFYFSLKPLPDA